MHRVGALLLHRCLAVLSYNRCALSFRLEGLPALSSPSLDRDSGHSAKALVSGLTPPDKSGVEEAVARWQSVGTRLRVSSVWGLSPSPGRDRGANGRSELESEPLCWSWTCSGLRPEECFHFKSKTLSPCAISHIKPYFPLYSHGKFWNGNYHWLKFGKGSYADDVPNLKSIKKEMMKS